MKAEHVEYQYRSEASDTVVVFTHGIRGSPLQFEFMIDKLGGLYSIENLLLPGHGKTEKEFLKSSMAEWQGYVDARIGALQKAYRNIILVGHSMGCLLSVQSAVSYPQQIRGLFLIALPLVFHMRHAYFKNNFNLIFSKDDGDELIAAGRRVHSVSVSNPLGYLHGFPRYIELLKKSRSTRDLIKRLQAPTVVVQPENDEIMSGRSLRYVAARPNIRALIVEKAGHYYFPGEARELMSDALMNFIAETISLP